MENRSEELEWAAKAVYELHQSLVNDVVSVPPLYSRNGYRLNNRMHVGSFIDGPQMLILFLIHPELMQLFSCNRHQIAINFRKKKISIYVKLKVNHDQA